MIVNSDLHNQFDAFKTAEIISSGISYLEMNSLLSSYILQNPNLNIPIAEKYAKTYLTLTTHQVDNLCQWIYHTRALSGAHIHSNQGL